MRPVAIGGRIWAVRQVPPGDPSLVDRTGLPRLATTDPATRTISVSSSVVPPLLDRVLLHEMAHVASLSDGRLPLLRSMVPRDIQVFVEEWAAEQMESHGIEVVVAASESLGRPVCVAGECLPHKA